MLPLRLCLLTSALAFASYGQALNGTILGSVADASGALVPNAKVSVLELNTNLTRSVQSVESGNYTFPNLPAGLYTVSVELAGFRKSVRERVEVTINSTNRIDFQLQPGQITEQIEVTAEAPALQTDRTDTGRSMAISSAVMVPALRCGSTPVSSSTRLATCATYSSVVAKPMAFNASRAAA